MHGRQYIYVVNAVSLLLFSLHKQLSIQSTPFVIAAKLLQ